MRIGFIGLGKMGVPMSKNIMKSGYDLTIFDINNGITGSMEKKGVKVANSPCDLANDCEIIITMLPNSEIVKEVVMGTKGIIHGVKSDSILIDMSSSSPETTREIGEQLAEIGVIMIDAPVSGGVNGAQEGTLTIMIGGEEKEIEKVKPILKTLGKTLVTVGSLGCGHAVKALNNMMAATTFLITSEAIIAGVKYGANPKSMIKAINLSSGRNYSSEHRFPFVLENDFKVRFTNNLILKDLGTAVDVANHVDTPVLLGGMVHQYWKNIVSEIGGEEDYSSVIKYIEKVSNFTLVEQKVI